jgi:hypothetical protein
VLVGLLGVFCVLGFFFVLLGLFCDLFGLFSCVVRAILCAPGIFCDLLGLVCVLVGLFSRSLLSPARRKDAARVRYYNVCRFLLPL